jgi:hypothetical protein
MPTQDDIGGWISQLNDNNDAAGRSQSNRNLQECLADEDCAKEFGGQIEEAYDDLGLTPEEVENLPVDFNNGKDD